MKPQIDYSMCHQRVYKIQYFLLLNKLTSSPKLKLANNETNQKCLKLTKVYIFRGKTIVEWLSLKSEK